MKKTFLTLGAVTAASCVALALAYTTGGSVNPMPQGEKSIDKESAARFSNAVAPAQNIRKASGEENPNMKHVDLFEGITQMYCMNDGGAYDMTTNTFSFPGSSSYSNQIFIGTDDDGYTNWIAQAGAEFVFNCKLTSTGYAEVEPCIVYANDSGNLTISAGYLLALDETNNYTADFSASTTSIPDGSVVYLAYIIQNSSEDVTITSTENEFYYEYESIVAEAWDGTTDYPGLNLQAYASYNPVTLTLNDGLTTIGLINYGGGVYVTGINTTAESVEIPAYVMMNDTKCHIDYLGTYWQTADWSAATSLKELHLPSINTVYDQFANSSVTDLYLGSSSNAGNSTIYTSSTYYNNIYLHIPYNVYRANYTSYGFKRVLKGDELPSYPEPSFADYVIASDTQEGTYFGITYDSYDNIFSVNEIFSDEEEVILPEATPYTDGLYWVRRFGSSSSSSDSKYLAASAPNLKSVVLPENYQKLRVSWNNVPFTDLHIRGAMPETYWTLTSKMNVYVGSQDNYFAFEESSNWNKATILPDGWEFEWLTVEVGRRGEFAQTYIEMTDGDWTKGTYVKVTGELNQNDLTNMKNMSNLRKLDLSEASFESLPHEFMYGSNLTEVWLPESLKTINTYAFSYSKALRAVYTDSILMVGSNSFYGCENLTDFNIANATYIDDYAFQNCGLYTPEISNQVEYIGYYAFYATAIENLVLPETLITLGTAAFEHCKSLKSAVLPASITSIPTELFDECQALESVEIPEGVRSMGRYVFSNCTSLTEITLPSTLQRIDYSIFSNCNKLTSVKCKAVEPPTASGVFTYGMDLTHCTLYVPPFTLDEYRETEYWDDFYIMKPLDEPVKNIVIRKPLNFNLLSEDNAVLAENPNMTLNYDSSNRTVGQLSAEGDGTLSAGIFTICHSFESRSNSYYDYRTTLVNDAENMRADSVVCSIDFSKNTWHFVSFQYDVQMEDVYGLNGTDFVVRQYNAEKRALGESGSNWEPVPADGVLKAGKGYIVQAANNTYDENGYSQLAEVCFPSRNTTTKNNLFTNGNIIVPLDEYPAEFAHNRSWNLVGNPYPCYYDMHALLNDWTTPIVLWRESSYQAYSPVDDDIILRPNEAFFVQRPLDAEEMVFGVEGRMNYSSATSQSNITPGVKAPAMNDSQRAVFNFNVKGQNSDDRARIVMNEEAKADYEISRDAVKFFSEAAAGIEMFVSGNARYDICERPFGDGTATLGLRAGTDGEYTISLAGRNTEGWTVYLTDNENGNTICLSERDYTFTVEAGLAEARFTLVFANANVDGINSISADKNADVKVIGVNGVTVFEGKLGDFRAPANGIYIISTAEKAYTVLVK